MIRTCNRLDVVTEKHAKVTESYRGLCNKIRPIITRYIGLNVTDLRNSLDISKMIYIETGVLERRPV